MRKNGHRTKKKHEARIITRIQKIQQKNEK